MESNLGLADAALEPFLWRRNKVRKFDGRWGRDDTSSWSKEVPSMIDSIPAKCTQLRDFRKRFNQR